jgi:Icc-related predicted phosphoesterase
MLSILAVSDVHGSQRARVMVDHYLHALDPDLMTVTGDITHFGPAEWAKEFLTAFDVPVLVVNGNCDTHEVVDVIRGMDQLNLMGSCKEFSGVKFAGLAYPPRNPDYEGPVDVLLTHEPPRGCNDEVPPGRNIGSEVVKAVAERLKPRLLLSGHVHEARGICALGETLCVNPGPAGSGMAAIINISEKIEARLLTP